jgi:hypothetical protein
MDHSFDFQAAAVCKILLAIAADKIPAARARSSSFD